MIVQQEIEQQLKECFSPVFLDVANESHQHSVPPNSETHFRVVMVAGTFEGKRQGGAPPAGICGAGVATGGSGARACTAHLYTPHEWQQRQQEAPALTRVPGR